MKVESQTQTQGVQSVGMDQSINAELQATMLMRVLSRATEEIHEASLEAKAEPLKTEGEEGASAPNGAMGSPKTNKSNEQKILDCFITSLNADFDLHILTQETVKTLLTKSKQMLKDFADLKSQIEEISNQLNDMMARNMIDKIRVAIKQMIENAVKAFAKEQKAIDDIAAGGDSQGMLDDALSEIAGIISAVEELIAQAPSIKAELTQFIQTLTNRGPIAAIGEVVLQKLDEIEQERDQLEGELARLLEAQNALLSELSTLTRELKDTLSTISSVQANDLTEKGFKEILENISNQIKKAIERDVNESKDYLDVRANNDMINQNAQSQAVYG